MKDADLAWYLDDALDAMVTIVVELGDEDANAKPGMAGALSPYAILAHCIGVMQWWGGRMLAGRDVPRDRPAEFAAAGAVADLAGRAAAARRQLATDLDHMDPAAPPAVDADPGWADLPMGRNQAGVALHIVQELTRHLGQLQLTRDMLRDPQMPRRTS